MSVTGIGDETTMVKILGSKRLQYTGLLIGMYIKSTRLGRTLRERLRTHKKFTKDQCFYLNYHKFSIKSYVLDVYFEAILIHIQNMIVRLSFNTEKDHHNS